MLSRWETYVLIYPRILLGCLLLFCTASLLAFICLWSSARKVLSLARVSIQFGPSLEQSPLTNPAIFNKRHALRPLASRSLGLLAARKMAHGGCERGRRAWQSTDVGDLPTHVSYLYFPILSINIQGETGNPNDLVGMKR